MAKEKGPQPPETYTFQDGNSAVFTGTPQEIVIAMKHLEWGETPPPQEWKERVRRRAAIFGIEMEFFDAFSLLQEMERHGLGRFIPDFVGNDTTMTDLDSTNGSIL